MRRIHAMLLGFGLGILVILVLEGLGLAQTERPVTSPPAAVVNGEVIPLSEVDATIAQRPTPLNVPTSAQVRQTRSEVVTALIDDLLLRQFLREQGAKIEAALIDKQFAALEESLKAQNKTLSAYLRELNQTEAQVRASMTMLLQLDHYVKEHTSEAEMRKYYETNKDYFDRVTVRTSHIVIRLSADAAPVDREKAKEKLRALRSEIMAGKLDFAQAAREHSHCPSAPKGGDIGFIFRKFQNVDEIYAKTAFALKVGAISDVVESEFGIHLIKVTERIDGKPTKYDQVSNDVRDCFAEELRMTLLQQLRQRAKVELRLP